MDAETFFSLAELGIRGKRSQRASKSISAKDRFRAYVGLLWKRRRFTQLGAMTRLLHAVLIT
jgi:hypothetical protein